MGKSSHLDLATRIRDCFQSKSELRDNLENLTASSFLSFPFFQATSIANDASLKKLHHSVPLRFIRLKLIFRHPFLRNILFAAS